MNKKKNNKGFSLIELIIAIAILIILTGMLAPQFMKYIEKSREAKDVQAMDTVYSSVQAALANEAAYDAMVELTSTGVYADTLKNALDDKTSFGVELKSLLGNTSTDLKSKKATDKGEICIAVKYQEDTETVVTGTGTDGKDITDTVEVFAGFEIMVYCGDSGYQQIPGLAPIGGTIDIPTKPSTP